MAENVREIKARIGNIENIRQITKAMNAIAMTRVTRMKRRLAAVQPYMEGLEGVISSLVGQYADLASAHPLVANNGSEDVGILVLNADRGLCGRFKGDLNHKAETLAQEKSGTVRFLLGGEKARAYFARRRVEPLRTYVHFYEDPTLVIARKIASDLISLYKEGAYGSLVVVYMHFISDLAQRLRVEKILPITAEARAGDVILEPNPTRMLDIVLPLYLQGKVFQALLDTKTSEDAIRRQAMSSATDNADDLLKNLTRSYNKARQQSITREISDIMGGAEALRN
ncbi:MAG: ATP synthase F1 subunit gamma [Candidatus Bipolaricaulota bacterium]|nr:ATP synthase F1 subunit gamma [Candidatus Bipolaricaulota bacterium]